MTDWKLLAKQEAHRQNVQLDIVLATVEAETGGRNITGDKGNALGYGQVWPKWHMNDFIKVGKDMNLTVPNDLPSLTNLVLGNDLYSMGVAVSVIKKMWSAANKDWVKFTKMYVGPAIPEHDLLRRKAIWEKYAGKESDYNATITEYDSMMNLPQIPATNYKVVEDSFKKGNYLYGRKYRVLVSDKNGNALDVSGLRCKFKISKTMMMQPNLSEVTIYNLSPETENVIIKEGARIVLEAGYEGSHYGIVYDGDIIQSIRGKEEGVDYTLTLIGLDGDSFFNSGFINLTLAKGMTKRDIVAECTSKAKVPIEINKISDEIGKAKLTRGKVLFGLSSDYLRQISQSENATFYIDNGKVNIVRASDLPKDEIITLSPTSGLIGSPEQTEFGVNAKSLLNPKIKINSLIHIDNSLVRERKIEFGQMQRSLDIDGIYRVIKLTIVGDTRGEDWYTEMETITQSGYLPSMLNSPDMYPW